MRCLFTFFFFFSHERSGKKKDKILIQKIVKSVSQLKKDEEVDIRLTDGKAKARIL